MLMNEKQALALVALIAGFASVEYKLIVEGSISRGLRISFKTENSTFTCSIDEKGTVTDKREKRTFYDW